jgi:hypothetical protein
MMVAAVAESGAAVAEVGMAVVAAVTGPLEMGMMVGAADTGVSPGAASPTLTVRAPHCRRPCLWPSPGRWRQPLLRAPR